MAWMDASHGSIAPHDVGFHVSISIMFIQMFIKLQVQVK
jgi:hypothetical protein